VRARAYSSASVPAADPISPLRARRPRSPPPVCSRPRCPRGGALGHQTASARERAR